MINNITVYTCDECCITINKEQAYINKWFFIYNTWVLNNTSDKQYYGLYIYNKTPSEFALQQLFANNIEYVFAF